MKLRPAPCRLCVALLGFACALPLAAQEWAGPASLEVSVEDAKGKSVQGAEVALEYLNVEGDVPPAPQATDSAGRCAIGGLAPGAWSLEVSKPGFMSYRAEILVALEGKPEIVVASQHNVPGAVSTLRVRLGRAKNAPLAKPAVVVMQQSPPVSAAPAEDPGQGQDEKLPLKGVTVEAGVSTPAAAVAPAAPIVIARPDPVPAPQATPMLTPAPAAPAPVVAPPAAAPSPAAAPAVSPAPSAPVQPKPVAVPAPAPVSRPESAPLAAEPVEAPPVPAPAPVLSPPRSSTPPSAATQPQVAPAPSPMAPAPVPKMSAAAPPEAAPEELAPATPASAPAVHAAPAPSAALPVPAASPPPSPPPAAPAQTPPQAVPPVAPSPAPAVAAPMARSCFECKPGESALAVAASVAAGGARCADDAAARLRAAAAGEIEPLRSALGSGCALLRIDLPKGARYTGFRYEAEGPNGRAADCLPGKECPIGASRFIGEPIVRRDGDSTSVLGLFEASADRRGTLTVYWSRSRK